ncbi:leucyl aminopeptidase [Asticcacaulis sp. ZE23SCel15]|uniref:leucyl aminopeptidase n=1 Tax=Asticcacaulis sp. ZE23SCel15 TaxID=3059027 RepID=UPI00266039D7|nr:leucyl aminopeptidase [Asticcacaulis sp. ZE23SCel15]WKL56380.1 leucyl aminopeptidase [Asticcacaulis sp. ZE23SCel15]
MHIQLATQYPENHALAVLIGDGDALSAGAEKLNTISSGYILGSLKKLGFKSAKGKVQILSALPDQPYTALAVLAAGDLAGLKGTDVESVAASLYHATKSAGFADLAIDMGGFPAEQVAHAMFALTLASYRFDKYFGAAKLDKAPSLKSVTLICDDVAEVEAAYAPLKAIADGVIVARDLVSEPANVLYPQSYADRIKGFEALGLKVEVLGEDEMTKLGMFSLLGVGLGSRKESKLVVMQWLGADDKSAQPVAFVGKGVTFDTGGISIKPAEGMEDMKWDMGGSATVVGTMVALAGRKAKVNAIGVVGLVENMPDGNAQRPGDVVTAMSGTTIEVINTDAEGRLVLADALWYTQDRFKPQFMIDLATLTGAMIIALGMDYAGVFSNNDELAERISEASESVLENTWRMPLPAQYEKQIDSKIADIRNIGGRPGGSITAALFLQRFVNNVPWAHLDIAPTAWTNEQRLPTVPEGATGWGVRTLDALVKAHYEV